MKKLAIAFAGLAAIGFSGAAFAEEASTGSRTITTGPAAMTDAEMDKVTAGTFIRITPPCRGGGCPTLSVIEVPGSPPDRRLGVVEFRSVPY